MRKLLLLSLLVVATPALAGDGYKDALKKWTRQDKVYQLRNLEMRAEWHATYLSPEFRQVQLEKEQTLMSLLPEEVMARQDQATQQLKKYDEFFISIYAGSSEWRDIGKKTGLWRFLLEVPGKDPVKALSQQRVTDDVIIRKLYPYITPWAKTLILRFPKTITPGESFQLTMAGIPAESKLSWAP